MQRIPLALLLCALGACAANGSTDGADAGTPEDASVADLSTEDLSAEDLTGQDLSGPLGAPGTSTRTIPGWPMRAYELRIPASYDGKTRLPVILNLHGGGGDRSAGQRTTCPGGDLSSSGCLAPMADARGFIVVSPDGTGTNLLPNLRTWNAGGGTLGYQCVSGYACTQKVDEAAYFTALLADLATAVHFDATRVYATGFSNGAAMAQRLACELPAAIAGIAPVSGGNQFASGQACAAATPVLEIHGTADPCWPYAGGAISCADNNPGVKVAIPDTLSAWRSRNGCTSTSTDTALPDVAVDGTTTVRHAYACPSGQPVLLYEVVDGGHTWPSGYSTGSNGPMSTDFSANQVILDFFASLP